MTSLQKEAYKPHRMGDHSDTNGCSGDDDPCYCNEPKDLSLQKESEWKEKFNNIFVKEAGNWRETRWVVPYVEAGADALRRFISHTVSTAVSQREQEISEEVEKMKKECPNHNSEDRVECYGYDEMHNDALDKVLSILKNNQ